MSDVQNTLGKILDESQTDRDAIHVAILPVEAKEKLWAGDDVTKDGKRDTDKETSIGIVDPFLTKPVQEGQRFWLFLYPNTVTGMRHHWMHPVVDEVNQSDEPPSRLESEVELLRFSDEAGMSLSGLIDRVTNYVESGDPWVEHDSETARNAWYGLSKEQESDFWMHFENYTGVKKPNHDWDAPFSCSC